MFVMGIGALLTEMEALRERLAKVENELRAIKGGIDAGVREYEHIRDTGRVHQHPGNFESPPATFTKNWRSH